MYTYVWYTLLGSQYGIHPYRRGVVKEVLQTKFLHMAKNIEAHLINWDVYNYKINWLTKLMIKTIIMITIITVIW